MMSLPDGWQSDYDGTRWLFRHKAMGVEQYHFPQPGDEYAGFLHDAGTGPVKLTPEDSLAIEQQAKRRSISGWDNDTNNGTKTSGSKREKKKIEDIGEENGMSATGYYDPMLYLGAYNNGSPLGVDDSEESAFNRKAGKGNAAPDITSEATPPTSNSEPILNPLNRQSPSTSSSYAQPVAVELPGGSRQTWSPVGYVAELATQDTVKCAEELAPVELDATSFMPAPIRTNIAQEPAELPAHRSPVEEKAPNPKPTQPAMQLVDSSSLTTASFAYSPQKPQMNPTNRVSSGPSIKRKPVSSGTNPVELGQNKYQPWNPTQGTVEQPSQVPNKAPEALPQTSVLQNQNSELGSIDRKDSEVESTVQGDIPNALARPSAPSKPAPIESSITNNEASSVPSVLQPAQRPAKEPVPLEPTNQQFIPGTQARHDSILVSDSDYNLSYAPSVLKPGGRQSNNSIQESEGNLKPKPPHSSNQYQESIISHHPFEHAAQASSNPNGQPSITKVNTFPSLSNHETTVYPDESSKPAFKPYTPDSGQVNSEPCIGDDEQIPAVAPLSFVKRHSSKSSVVSSITPETQDWTLHPSKPALTQSDEISEVISVINSFTPQATSAPVVDAQQSSVISQVHEQVPPAAANISNPIPVTATPVTQTPAIPSSTNVGIATTQGRPNVQHANNPSQPVQGSFTPDQKPSSSLPPQPVQGSFAQNQKPSPSLPSQTGNPVKISMSPGPLGPQGNTSNPLPPQTSAVVSPGHKPSQASNIPHTNQAHQPGVHSSHANDTTQRPPQAPQVNMTTSNINGPAQSHVTASVQQTPYRPQGQSNPSPNPIAGPSTIGYPQAATQNPNFQQPATTGPSSPQPTARPPVGHQVLGSAAAQISSQSYQHPSPVMHTVSPIQSQVSSPAQSIASLHISQASTPANTFATMNTVTNTTGGSNVGINHTTTPPVRPPSVSAHAPTQPVGNVRPPASSQASAAGILQAQSLQMANPPVKPYPMLPGQVTPLPSQIGSAPIPPPVSQPIPNNYAKPTANTQQQAIVGQQPMQTATGGPTAHHAIPGQMNQMVNPPHGNVAYGPAASQAQVKPPQFQSTPSSHPGVAQTGGYQPSAYQLQPQLVASYPSPIASGQPHGPQTAVPPLTGSLPVGGQPTFQPPPMTYTALQGKPFNSTQATAALTDAGKGMKKWAKKMWSSPAVKQTTVAIGGAIMAESVGMGAGAGAQLASNLYGNANRPPLAHAQTAPPQANGIPGAAPQHQPMQMGQQQQPDALNLDILSLGSLNLGQPQPGQPQLGRPQPTYQPVGIQTPARPPVVYNQNPTPAAGVAVNINAQAQAQANFYQQQQYALVNPVMVSNPPRPVTVGAGAPNSQAEGQANIDANTAANAAIMISSVIGAALRPGPSQPQHANGNSQGYAQQDHTPYAGSHSAENQGYPAENHGYPAENYGYSAENHAVAHEQVYDSSIPPQASATYTDNSYMTTDTTYVDNSSYSANNVYLDNTDVTNNTIGIDNSTTSFADMTYSDTSYVDATLYSNTDITTDISIDVDVNSTLYADGSVAAFSVDESITIASTSDVAVASTDYSGDSWGDFFSF
ncbi:hypothetical protein E0Z10_g7628 [Xylaria hypoxylon]|uniref:Uncharacterized protein n=1 Tax=Xylaria hypoxylon TaxID=37992 RepID=A0A4Z0YRM4_9PEZI|nr:hypothetical protein E0Z10_g7628 [Xylaria hypoxylon]